MTACYPFFFTRFDGQKFIVDSFGDEDHQSCGCTCPQLQSIDISFLRSNDVGERFTSNLVFRDRGDATMPPLSEPDVVRSIESDTVPSKSTGYSIFKTSFIVE